MERAGPDLTGPDPTGPDLTGPDLTGPDPTGPDLSGADRAGRWPAPARWAGIRGGADSASGAVAGAAERVRYPPAPGSGHRPLPLRW